MAMGHASHRRRRRRRHQIQSDTPRMSLVIGEYCLLFVYRVNDIENPSRIKTATKRRCKIRAMN